MFFFNRLRGGYARPFLLKGRLRAGYAVRGTPREATQGRFYCRGRLRGAYDAQYFPYAKATPSSKTA